MRLQTRKLKDGRTKITAYDGRKSVGAIAIYPRYNYMHGGEIMQVLQSNVRPGRQREGIGTKLYEAAAQAACDEGMPLASSPEWMRSPYSSGFWAKQARKGRAKDIGDGVFVLDESCGADLSGLPTGCMIEEKLDRFGNPDQMGFSVLCGDDIAGWMDVFKRDDIDGVPGAYWAVNNVYIKDRYQRRGFATKLYEAAARRACEDGLPLVSPSRLQGAKSTSFWEKQVRKGRAQRIARPHRYEAFGSKARGAEQMDVFKLDCEHASDLSGVQGSCVIHEDETGGRSTMRFHASCSGDPRGEEGYIKVNRVSRKVKGKTVWTVSSIAVTASARRAGIGTALYEAAAEAVCKRRNALVSFGPRTDKSEGFWQKQLRKGRAVEFKQRDVKQPGYLLDCEHASDLSALEGFSMTRNTKIGIGIAGVLALAMLTRSRLKPTLKVSQLYDPEPYIYQALERAADKYNVPLRIMLGVAFVESRYDEKATSPVGAMGLMQLMPNTAKNLGVYSAYNAQQNAYGGAKLLDILKRQYGSWEKALAAYNWGQGNVTRNPSPSQWPKATRSYVANVLLAARVLG